MRVSLDTCGPQFDWLYDKKPYLRYVAKSKKALLEGDLQSAEDMNLAAINVSPTNPLPYVYVANIKSLQGKNDEANEYLEIALFINKDNGVVQLIAGQYYLDLGFEDRAFEHLVNSYELSSSPARSKRYYTDAYRQMRLPVDSSPFLYSTFLTENTTMLYLYLADHLEEKGDEIKAEEIRKWVDWNTPPPRFDE